MELQRAETIQGTLRVPGDKSIAHRALILGAVARGKQVVEGAPRAADVKRTASCLRSLGTFIEEMPDGRLLVLSKEFESNKTLDAGNSGTTARLLAGLLAGYPTDTTLDGDASLRKRPMARVAEPLRQMGATVETTDGHLPMRIRGGRLRAVTYRLPVASAQVKSAVLLAGLRAEGATVVEEPTACRDHTERMLEAMAVPITRTGGRIELEGGAIPKATRIQVPGDISAAAFFIVAATCVDGSDLYLPTLGVNPTRTGVLDALASMGADIERVNPDTFSNEPIADIAVRSAPLNATTIGPDLVPRLIDELPVLAVAATQAEGTTRVTGATELRHKESDRIEAIVANLSAMGARIEGHEDGFVIEGPTRLAGARVSAFGDHRIAMAMAVAGLLADGRTTIDGSEVVDVSYPGFLHDLLSVIRLGTPS